MQLTPETYKAYNRLTSGNAVCLLELLMRDIYYSHDDRDLLEIRLELSLVLIDKILSEAQMNGVNYKAYFKLKNKIEERLLPKLNYFNLTEKAFNGVFNQKFPYGFKHHLHFLYPDINTVNRIRYVVGADEMHFCQYFVSPEIISRLKLVV